MYQAKEFYTLAGVKRSTVRHYVEQGLISPADIRENGYAIYSDAQLLDIMLLKSERSLDFGIHEINENRSVTLRQRIEDFEMKENEYNREIEALRQKIDAIKLYKRILAEMVDTGERTRIDQNGRRAHESFWIGKSIRLCPTQTAEEIEHCIKAFPSVNVILRGKKEDLLNPKKSRIPMEIGYKYDIGRVNFVPLHKELYETLPAQPSVLLRTTTHSPLLLDKNLLRPIDEAIRSNGLRNLGDLYVYIHAVETTKTGKLYYITARVVVENLPFDNAAQMR